MTKRAAASSNPLPAPQPIEPPLKVVRSCSRCLSKKSKCVASLPYCSPCWSAGRTDDCDIEQHVVLPYAVAKERERVDEDRRRRLDWLEAEMSRRTGTDVGTLATGSTVEESNRVLGRVQVDPLTLELGLLALDATGAPSRTPLYVGTASGLTITRLLAAPLQSCDDFGPVAYRPGAAPERTACAGIPPVETARSHLLLYLERVHRNFPCLDLTELLRTFDSVYGPRSIDSAPLRQFDRFLFFAVLAIASSEARSVHAGTGTPQDPFSPPEYIASALPFLAGLPLSSDLRTLKALLLMSLYGTTDSSGPPINLWHYAGHAMRVAIELGLTRPVSAWSLPPAEEEHRRRLWWCTYRLERTVAVRLGRVLSIRNEGIDAEWPIALEESTVESAVLGAPVKLNYKAGLHLVRLSRLYGEILESVYIARPVHRPSMTIEETLQRVWRIQAALVDWANSIPTIATAQSNDSNLLTLAFHRAVLLLHRPSPSFPNQPESVHSVCIRSARAGISLARSMLDARTLSLNLHNLHDAFLDGLVLMYSSWASPTSVGAITILDQTRDADLEVCSVVLERLSSNLATSARRYIDVFANVVTAFENLVGIGMATAGAQCLFDWSIFDEMDGFELDGGAVEMIRSLTSNVRDEPQ